MPLFTIAILAGLLLGFPVSIAAGVVVFDRITTVGKPVFLKILTKGQFFSEGGRRVEVRIGNRQSHHLLSGGDGYAYFKYLPQAAGFEKIIAVSDGDEASGLLLVMNPGETALVIGTEGGLRTSLFSEKAKSDSREALIQLNKQFRIVYLTRWLGMGLVKNWLKREKYPPSVVLRWRGPEVFKKMKNSDIEVAAVIGSAALMKAAPEYVKGRYTFEKTTKGTTVKDWAEIVRLIRSDNGGSTDQQPGLKDQD